MQDDTNCAFSTVSMGATVTSSEALHRGEKKIEFQRISGISDEDTKDKVMKLYRMIAGKKDKKGIF